MPDWHVICNSKSKGDDKVARTGDPRARRLEETRSEASSSHSQRPRERTPADVAGINYVSASSDLH